MSILDDIMNESKTDLTLSQDISLEITKTFFLFNKYFKLFSEYSKIWKKEKRKLDKIIKFRSDYYLGKCSPEVYQHEPFGHKVLKGDLAKFLQADSYICHQEEIVDEYELIVSYLENVIQKHINARQYVLKTMLDFIRFSAGN